MTPGNEPPFVSSELPRHIKRNAIYNWVGWIWPLALQLVATPFIVSRLGVEAYGVFALLSVLLGYLSIMDLGFSEATVKFIAEHYGRQETSLLETIFRCSLLLYSLFGIVGAIILATLTTILVEIIFHTPQPLVQEAKFAFYVTAFSFLINMWVGVFSSVPKALQRYDLLNSLRLALGTLTTLGIVAVLALNLSLRAVVIVQFISSILGLWLHFVIVRYLLPGMKWWPQFDRQSFRRLFGFGGMVLINRITNVVAFQVPQGIIAAVKGPVEVTYYTVPFKLALPIQTMFSTSLQAFFPMSAAMVGAGQNDSLKNVYVRVSQLLVFSATALALPMVILSSDIMRQWMGPEFATNSYFVLLCLAGAFWLNAFAILPAYILLGAGLAKFNALLGVIGAVYNVVGSLVLAPRYGANGLAAALLLSSVLNVPLAIWLVHSRVLHLPTLHVLYQAYLRPILAALSAGAVAQIVIVTLRINGVASLLGAIAFLEALYLGFALLFGAVWTQDIGILLKLARFKLEDGP